MDKKTNIPSQPEGEPTRRRTYAPPSITFTEIEVEEALMGLCKTSSGGNMPGMCLGGCSTQGS